MGGGEKPPVKLNFDTKVLPPLDKKDDSPVILFAFLKSAILPITTLRPRSIIDIEVNCMEKTNMTTLVAPD